MYPFYQGIAIYRRVVLCGDESNCDVRIARPSWMMPAMRLRTLLVIASLIALVSISPVALADGVVRDGVGPISTGRGATNLGFADNAAIILDNPAGMSNVAGTGLLEGGVDTVIPGIHYTDPDNPNVNNILRGFPCGMIGYVSRSYDS